MKHIAVFSILFLISSKTFAQKERFSYQPKLWQASLGVGFVNTGLRLEHRLGRKTMASIDAGVGLARVESNYYNRFNENYGEYDEYSDNFLNWGREWWSPYTAVHLKRIITGKSRRKYDSAPFANTFTYYGIQLKWHGREWGRSDASPDWPLFRETYQAGAFIGRQVELTKDGAISLDLYTGAGGIINYNFRAIEPKWLVGFRLAVNVWSKND